MELHRTCYTFVFVTFHHLCYWKTFSFLCQTFWIFICFDFEILSSLSAPLMRRKAEQIWLSNKGDSTWSTTRCRKTPPLPSFSRCKSCWWSRFNWTSCRGGCKSASFLCQWCRLLINTLVDGIIFNYLLLFAAACWPVCNGWFLHCLNNSYCIF